MTTTVKTNKYLPAHLRTFKLTKRELAAQAFRDRVIAALGLEPEDRTSAGSRYAMTTGEFMRELRTHDAAAWAVLDAAH